MIEKKRYRNNRISKNKDLIADKYNIESTDLNFCTCSTYDCTGLIPSIIRTEEEAESYEQLYPYLPPEEEDNKSTR